MADEKRYTLEQAAAEVGFRTDDLVALLPDANIDLSTPGHEGNTLSAEEVARLSHWVTQIKQLHDNAPDGGA